MLLDLAPQHLKERRLAKKTKKTVRREWTPADLRTLKKHSKDRTPVAKISKEMKRTVGALRQKALVLGVDLGHQR
ncbi:hypothetical protein CWO91_10280 [Bradyrhizobium genosp. SA-3]|nr:hypothetical protein [Bradyrhizobium genosp. SA-3]RZN11062.1 hypothetical protein CWO91_10280 [Bradyrhizobium genosp. SA-3]